jgi:AcrR family transcriptional regulator
LRCAPYYNAAVISTEPRPPGRPRDVRIDETLLRFAGEVMLERGYVATSISEIARRAGVGTPAIYRRWPNKAAIAIDVFEAASGENPLADTGSVRNDLTEFTRLRIRQYNTPIWHQIVLPLMMEQVREVGVDNVLSARVAAYREPLFHLINGWVKAGKLRPDTNARRMLDALMGAVAVPLLLGLRLPDESEAEAIVEGILKGYATG